ncbi:hypothetical protein [Flavobacterium sp. DG2-3]|uniref:hypothetical protein n=1 Tax=Flavobacterium sp. DG2-3 TaxID=3068317 RepID=UPI00273F7763|nr:hypothetical protein [Flavobacterium sp. DG2-3]MDP5200306.1 hypothetical protein [Flavobacterium sp. DG2-3]
MKNSNAVIADMTSSMGGQINPAMVIVNLQTGFAGQPVFFANKLPYYCRWRKSDHKSQTAQSGLPSPDRSGNPSAPESGAEYYFVSSLSLMCGG